MTLEYESQNSGTFGRIRDPMALLDGVMEWYWLSGCFGGEDVVPSDVDGEVERRGFFLVLEHKRPGAQVPVGQMRLLEAKARLPEFTVVVFWAPYRFGQLVPPNVIAAQIIGKHREPVPCTTEKLKSFCRRWYAAVEGMGP